MNINANEILLLAKKNIKFRGEAMPAPQTTAVAEPNESTPQSGLNSLVAQGQNNIAFQGVKIPSKIKNGSLGAMMALSLFATGLTSCEKEVVVKESKDPIKVEVEVNVDFSAITDMVSAMQIMWKEMIEQQKLTNDQMILLNTQLSNFIEQYKNNQLDAEAFYNKMYDFMMNNSANQAAIINLLVQNGKTEEEATKFIKDILAEVKAGRLDAAKAYEKIMKEMGDINVSLTEIKALLQAIQEDLTSNHNEYINIKEEELELLANILNQGTIRDEQIKDLADKLGNMDKNIEIIKNNTTEMLEIAKDDSKFKELKEILKGLQPAEIDYKKFEEMFAIYGLSIENVIEMSGDEIEAILKDFLANYLGNETKENEILASINEKLSLINMFPGLDVDGLKDALAGLKDAVDNNTDAVTGELGDIKAQLDKIQATLDNMFKELYTLSDEVSMYNKTFAKNWETALAKLDGITGDLKDIKEAQNVSNTLLTNVNTNVNNLEKAQLIANGYLAALLDKMDEMKDLLGELEANSNGGMTIEEFKAYMQERDKAQYDKFVQFTVDMGFDKLPGDVSTIKDLLGAMNDKIQNLKDYSGQLDTIIAKMNKLTDWLKNADFSNPDYTAKLDKIIDLLENLDFTLECDCEHQDKNIDTNEGIVGDLGGIFG